MKTYRVIFFIITLTMLGATGFAADQLLIVGDPWPPWIVIDNPKKPAGIAINQRWSRKTIANQTLVKCLGTIKNPSRSR